MMSVLESHPGVPLERHLHAVAERVSAFCQDLQAPPAFPQAARLTALSHDLGKATKYFQRHLKGERVRPSLTGHSLLSAVLAVWHVAKDLPWSFKIPLFLAIRHHHTTLTPPREAFYLKHEWEKLEKQVKGIDPPLLRQVVEAIGLHSFENPLLPEFEVFKSTFSWPAVDHLEKNQGLESYFTTNLLLGMLADADIRAVIGMGANEERIAIPDDIVDRYLKKLSKSSPINMLRQEFYETVIGNVRKFGLENKFLALTAPTGLGKTLAGFSAAIRLRHMIHRETGQLPRIIYVLPFTSIIDQNFEVFANVLKSASLPEDILLKHHFRAGPQLKGEATSKSSPFEDVWDKLREEILFPIGKAEELFKRYEQAHTRVETWDGEITVTTFVRFYETLFTNRRSEMRRLHRLAGSIVIFDEVQNIPPKYWKATEEALKFLADQWGTRFIFMTATRPALFSDIPELTEPRKQHFFDSVSRTELHIDSQPVPYSEVDRWLLPKIKDSRSFMVVMNTVRAAQEVYAALQANSPDFKIYFLAASLIPAHREKRIAEINERLAREERIALVATQVVEAGVDLDFNIVIRDLGPFDSVVQAAGRCNRNALEKAGRVFLVNLINPEHNHRRLATYIYDGVLIDTTEDLLKRRKLLLEKEYLKLVEDYFQKLRERKAQDEDLLVSLKVLNYAKLGGFNFLEASLPQVPVFVEFDREAQKIVSILKKLEEMPATTYDNRLNRRKLFKSIASKMWGYVVNVPLKAAAEAGLGPLPYASSFLWLSKDHPDFRNIYCEDTGFSRKIEHEALFL